MENNKEHMVSPKEAAELGQEILNIYGDEYRGRPYLLIAGLKSAAAAAENALAANAMKASMVAALAGIANR